MSAEAPPRIGDKSALVRQTLAEGDVHEVWAREFLTPESETFSELAFDYIAARLERRAGEKVLDAGCGTGHNSLRLARRGFSVHGIDFSSNRVGAARARVAGSGLEDRVTISQDDLTALSFADGTFQHVVCWGVLMHIPDLPAALSELVRVLKPGGKLVIGENSRRSFDALLFWIVRKLQRRKWDLGENATHGREMWIDTAHGPLLIRFADIEWMISFLQTRGLTLRERRARQFTELFLRTRSQAMRRGLHAFNRFWFRWVRSPQLALGNLLIFEKSADAGWQH